METVVLLGKNLDTQNPEVTARITTTAEIIKMFLEDFVGLGLV
jgi:hypothetical protein